jgi:hypothetical protein
MMGECSQETAFSMLDYFYDMGGNFIDTANGYQAEESETWLGRVGIHQESRCNKRDDIGCANFGHLGHVDESDEMPVELVNNRAVGPGS